MTGALLIDLDGALGDTRALWHDWLASAATVLAVEPSSLPADRVAAAEALDATGVGNWRSLLERFAAERAPVYLRPNAEASAALRKLCARGVRLGVFTDAPAELASVAVAQLGATRRLEAVETGRDALEHLRQRLGDDATVVLTCAELVAAAR